MSAPIVVDRRDFLKAGAAAGAGLTLGFSWPAQAAQPAGVFAPNAWLRVDTSGAVTVTVAKSEMGQGILTSLPMLIAEELDVDWKAVRIELAPADKKYGNQLTGGSSSIRQGFEPLRQAGATARAMLVSAAAARWKVKPEACRTEAGNVVDSAGRKLAYGALASAAAKLPVPAEAKLKDPKDFRIVGKRTPRLDTPAKVDGSAVFGIDVKVPGMLHATVARSPVFGGEAGAFDAPRAKAVAGVCDVVPVPGGVGVVAESYWQAVQGRGALGVSWKPGANAAVTDASIRKQFEQAADKPGIPGQQVGDAPAALAGAAKRLEAVYEFPYLAHATMEPMNCTADVRPDRCEIWAPTQHPQLVTAVVAQFTGLPAEKVKVNITLMGGGFGRRAMPDFVLEAVRLSKAASAPVKVIWSREDDTQHDYYRPASLHRIAAGIDAAGQPVAWTHRVVSSSILAYNFPQAVADGKDEQLVEGAEIPYAIPNVLVDYAMVPSAVPVGWWRSVFNSQNAFVNECFLDELAAAGGLDPLELRRGLLAKSPRHKAVLELAAAKAGWGRPLPAGRTRGLAVHECFGTYVAQVAEVSVEDGAVRVHRVVCAVDCGRVVNPDTVEAQMESSIVYALSAALKGAITIAGGHVEQGNFNDYPILRMSETPAIEVHLVASSEAPGGVGEPGTPPAAPAVANAVFAATRRPVRRLPMNA